MEACMSTSRVGWRQYLKIHPACELFPLLPAAELKELGDDIKANGLQHPITLWRDGADFLLIDGRNRLDAMEAVGLKLITRPKAVDIIQIFADVSMTVVQPPVDPHAYVVSTNVRRRFGLKLHPDKTRFIDFRLQRRGGTPPDCKAQSFDFLGFTHSWGKSRKGKNVVRQTTAKSRFARSLAAVKDWCRTNRHRPAREQHAWLSAVINGHYAYYGITGNHRRLQEYRHQVVKIWRKWLGRLGGVLPMISPRHFSQEMAYTLRAAGSVAPLHGC